VRIIFSVLFCVICVAFSPCLVLVVLLFGIIIIVLLAISSYVFMASSYQLQLSPVAVRLNECPFIFIIITYDTS